MEVFSILQIFEKKTNNNNNKKKQVLNIKQKYC